MFYLWCVYWHQFVDSLCGLHVILANDRFGSVTQLRPYDRDFGPHKNFRLPQKKTRY